ncbi:virion structural protein [Cellulophaga phage phi46:3]|uniref:Right handed beta helix domain-containing protein n=1 Tax=Cellulophaga phage phi46:3 TaxID=1327985 RepID=S0A2Z6_9CAUD|nr:virion structural protein [Cellulophaga phage phi46:3]AGO48827.1 hypothetical protein Phi46:3_gp083 [Cellulophaga phage phi46:3]
MKYLFILLFPLFLNSQIPGTDGTGSVDDTSALQSWIDSGSLTKPLGNEIYLVSETLDIDQIGAQEVDFNGATITVNSVADRYAILIDKPDRSLSTLKNLTIDGNDFQRNGIKVESPVFADNVDILDFYSSTVSIIGWAININLTNYGDFTFTNCDVTKMYSEYNSIIGDVLGSARAYDIQVSAMPPNTFTVLIEDFVWNGFYGDDGGPIRVDDNTSENMSITNNSVTLKNGSVTAFTRRGIKMAMDNITIDNVFYKSITTSNPFYQYAEPAGLIGARPLDTDPNGLLDNIVIKNCTFDGSGNYPWALIDKANAKWSNNTFVNGAGIRIGNIGNSEIGDVVICGSNFGSGSKIHQQLTTVSNKAGTNIIIDSNNIADSNYLEFTTLNYIEQVVSDCITYEPEPSTSTRNQKLIYWRY